MTSTCQVFSNHLKSPDVWRTGSYCFAFPRPKDGQWMHYMLPLVGNINHAGQANTKLRWDHTAGAFLVVALRDIEQGEEVRTACSRRAPWHMQQGQV
jgi:hypothetical protein